MNGQDVLGPEACRRARERLLLLAEQCRARNLHDLGRSIEDAATRGIDEACAELLAVAPILVPANVDWDWLPNDWLVAMLREDGSFLAYWTWLPIDQGAG